MREDTKFIKNTNRLQNRGNNKNMPNIVQTNEEIMITRLCSVKKLTEMFSKEKTVMKIMKRKQK